MLKRLTHKPATILRNTIIQKALTQDISQKHHAPDGRSCWNTKTLVGVVQTVQDALVENRAVASD